MLIGFLATHAIPLHVSTKYAITMKKKEHKEGKNEEENEKRRKKVGRRRKMTF
jgi:hypothetical protein